MMQSALDRPLHLAIIMDGNGRWAQRRGLPRVAGHRAGASTVREVVRAAPDLGVDVLTLFAFSSDNWQRPEREVRSLMKLFERYLDQELSELQASGVQLEVIGRRDRLESKLISAIERAESGTLGGGRLRLRLAVDYSARYEIEKRLGPRHSTAPAGNAPDVDLLVRTSGEQRLSDFLLWESAYAELFFTPTLWPDFSATELAAIVDDFAHRDRRFGRVVEGAQQTLLADEPFGSPSLAPIICPSFPIQAEKRARS